MKVIILQLLFSGKRNNFTGYRPVIWTNYGEYFTKAPKSQVSASLRAA